MQQNKWLTVREAADLLRFDPETIRRSIRSGRLRAVKIGHSRKARWRIRADWLQQFPAGVSAAQVAESADPSLKPRAVVLVSGGLDSTTVLALAKSQSFDLYALTFRYGQRHELEVEAACTIAKQLGVRQHVIVPIDLRMFGASALTADLPVPKGRTLADMSSAIPVTYVPARNTIFLSFALAFAEVIDANDIFIGVNALDYSGYPDCRPEYIDAFQRMANLATKKAVEGSPKLTIHTPLINLTKGEIVRRGMELGVDYSSTSTCYDPLPSGQACGECDACLLRLKGFSENSVDDPVRYQVHSQGHP